MTVLRLCVALCVCALLSNCVTALRLAGDGTHDPVSGHQVGIGSPDAILDIDAVRVRVSPVVSVRKRPIPESYAFLFSWTPAAYNARMAEQGLRVASPADWDRQVQRFVASAVRGTGPALGPGANTGPADAKTIAQAERNVATLRRQAERSAFKPVVAADGTITRCNDTSGGKFGCTIGLTLSQATRLAYARAALARHRPGCTLAVIDPPEILALAPYTIKSRALSVVASVTCP